MEITREMAERALDAIFGKTKPIKANVHVTSGACAGVTVAMVKATGSVDEVDILNAVLKVYAENGKTVDLESESGKAAFMLLVCETIKRFVAGNKRVVLSERIAFTPKVYTAKRGKVGRPYMESYPIGIWKDLDCGVSADKSAEWLALAAQNAECNAEVEKAPRQVKARGKAVGRTTVVHCPVCGTEIVIANTENPAYA